MTRISRATLWKSGPRSSPGYPATPDGQASYFRAVQNIVAGLPNNRGLGVFYWEPAWTARTGAGWDPDNPSSANEFENPAVFDYADTALPAMLEFAPDAGQKHYQTSTGAIR